MKLLYQLSFTILFIILAACGPSAPQPTAEPEGSIQPTQAEELILPEQSQEGLRIALTPTGESAGGVETAPAEEAYPIPIPTPIMMDENYPPPPPSPPPPSGYDANPAAEDAIWILYPVGEQCAAAGRYPDLVTAVADLTAAGITIYDSEVTNLIVCNACGCPTSAHYRVSIDANQLATAQGLEWVVEE